MFFLARRGSKVFPWVRAKEKECQMLFNYEKSSPGWSWSGSVIKRDSRWGKWSCVWSEEGSVKFGSNQTTHGVSLRCCALQPPAEGWVGEGLTLSYSADHSVITLALNTNIPPSPWYCSRLTPLAVLSLRDLTPS